MIAKPAVAARTENRKHVRLAAHATQALAQVGDFLREQLHHACNLESVHSITRQAFL